MSLIIDDLRLLDSGRCCDDGAGEIGLEEGTGVEEPWCFFLGFFRLDSSPLVSDAERLGEPGRLRLLGRFDWSLCFGRPDGVLVPFVEAPDGILEAAVLALSFVSSSFFCSSFFFSSSEVSSSLYTLSV